jgi:hypothetical protein
MELAGARFVVANVLVAEIEPILNLVTGAPSSPRRAGPCEGLTEPGRI